MSGQDQRLLDLKASQMAGVQMMCPRCGQDAMKPKLVTNALSRHSDLYICDACGMDEAVRDYFGKPMPLNEWACMIDQQTG